MTRQTLTLSVAPELAAAARQKSRSDKVALSTVLQDALKAWLAGDFKPGKPAKVGRPVSGNVTDEQAALLLLDNLIALRRRDWGDGSREKVSANLRSLADDLDR